MKTFILPWCTAKKLTRDLLPLQLRFRFSLILLDLSFIILVEYPYPSVWNEISYMKVFQFGGYHLWHFFAMPITKDHGKLCCKDNIQRHWAAQMIFWTTSFCTTYLICFHTNNNWFIQPTTLFLRLHALVTLIHLFQSPYFSWDENDCVKIFS